MRNFVDDYCSSVVHKSDNFLITILIKNFAIELLSFLVETCVVISNLAILTVLTDWLLL